MSWTRPHRMCHPDSDTWPHRSWGRSPPILRPANTAGLRLGASIHRVKQTRWFRATSDEPTTRLSSSRASGSGIIVKVAGGENKDLDWVLWFIAIWHSALDEGNPQEINHRPILQRTSCQSITNIHIPGPKTQLHRLAGCAT